MSINGEEAALSTSNDQRRMYLRRKRGGKKGSITKRILQIDDIMKENGSRTRIRSLFDSLLYVQKEAKDINQSLEELQEDTEDWMDEINFQVDNIKAKIDEYLELRKEDAPSETGTSPWLFAKFMEDDPEEDFQPNEISKLTSNGVQSNVTNMTTNTMTVSSGNPLNPNLGYTSYPYRTSTTFSKGFDKQLYSVPHRSRVDPTPFQLMSLPKPHVLQNQVDSWIDELDATKPPPVTNDNKMEDSLATWFVQQGLPRIRIPWFDGSPAHYVEFITSFRDLVHDQGYLSTLQKCTYLHQAVRGEVKRSIQGYRNDFEGYVMGLKRIKYMFGQRSRIAEAVITKVVGYKPINNKDQAGLTEFYYTLSDCLVTLRKLNYASDLYSTDILRQACKKLPQYLLHKWADHCLTLRRTCEPNLTHLEAWLQERILASKDSYLPKRTPEDRPPTNDSRPYGQRKQNNDQNIDGDSRKWTGTMSNKQKRSKETNECYICKGEHRVHKCPDFRVLDASQRFEKAKKLKLCYNCLKKDHFTSKCKSKNSCFSADCTERHHTTLHDYFTDEAVKQEFSGKTETTESNGAVYLSVVPVELHGLDSTSITTYALLDSGSQSTLIRADVATKLKLKKRDKKVTISTINDSGSKTKVKETSLRVANRENGNGVTIDHCYIVPKTNFHMPKQQYPSSIMKKMNNTEGIKLHNASSGEIGILIGANAPSVHIPLEIKEGENSEPLAIKTMFGWTLFGASGQPETITINRLIVKHEEDLHTCIQRIWDQEFITNPTDRDEAPSIEDRRCYKKLEDETTFTDGKYQVPMLWKTDTALPNNRSMVENRFNQLQRRLRKDPSLCKMYKESMDKYLASGYAKKMSQKEADTIHPRTWYLPHYGVFNPNKPGKIRLVFDAAARFEGTCLNDALYTGPDLLNNLLGVLMRFRTHPIAFSADIEGMFNQVKVNNEDKDSLRFLWKDKIDSNEPPDTYQMVVHTMGATCSPTCANYALKRCARDQQEGFDPNTIETILRSFYVDDILKSINNVETGKNLIKELIEITKLGGNRLTKFVSNSKDLLKNVPEDLLSPSSNVNMEGQNQSTKALGVTWNTIDDTLTFLPSTIKATYTKRGILSVVSSVYDPLGFLSPFTTTAKMILQDVWKDNTGWDEQVNEDIQKIWQKWLIGLSSINTFKVNRCYNLTISPKIQLHIFGDASEKAYGAVAYLKSNTEPISISFVASKGRVAPTKPVTLPRLELSAATIAVRLYRLIIKEIDLPIEDSHFWSDSTLTLQYIKNEKTRFKTFVANRVTEIREVTEPSQWHHIAGDENPADIMTRGVFNVQDLLKGDSKRSWLKGPACLKNDESTWVSEQMKEIDPADSEIRKIFIAKLGDNEKTLITYSNYSQLDKIIRILAWALRFVKNCRSQTKILLQHLTTEETRYATTLLVKDVQRREFDEEIDDLLKNHDVAKESKLSQFKPFFDKDGVIRIGGRLKNAPISFDEKHQILIPNGYVAKLLAEKFHRLSAHVGINQTLAEIRRKYWILNGRTTVKKVIRSCLPCQRFKCKPEIPLMADLPEGRMDLNQPPFTNTGVDFFGPLIIKQGRKRLKRWVSLFTCMTVRCVHLEVVESLETDDFLNALQRFISRRQKPKKLYSDCGTNFKGAAKELEDEIKKLNQRRIGEFCLNKEIQWNFNPPAAPHMGGAWERLVRTVKSSMKFILKNLVLTEYQLITFVTEVENIVNSRPLTQISDDPSDLAALTPNHLLKGFNNAEPLLAEEQSSSNITKLYRKRWKHIQMCLDHFWARWKKEYLPTLTARGKWIEEKRNLTAGELVLLQTDSPRGQWPLGVIVETIIGRDDRIRMAYVRTNTGTYLRPASKIYRLDFNVR